METIQIVLDKALLQATDKAAKCLKKNRSALVRDALSEHLKKLELRAKEELDRQGYLKMPQTMEESQIWEERSTWPAE